MAKKSKAKKATTIRGFVVPTEWNDEDQPVAVIVQTEDGTEYMVEKSKAAAGLLELEDAEVEIHGQVDDADPDMPVLQVDSFEVLDMPEEWDEEDEGDEAADEGSETELDQDEDDDDDDVGFEDEPDGDDEEDDDFDDDEEDD